MSTAPGLASAEGVAHVEAATHEVHDEHHVHVYETSGIAEGNAKVPRFLLAVIVALFSFFVWFVVHEWSAQPSTAHANR